MAAKPLDPSIAEAVIRDWRTGEFSQRQLADKHHVSTGKVANLTKGVVQDASSIVSAGIEYKQGLAAHDERMVSAITDAVDQRVKRQEWLNVMALKNVKEAMSAACEGQSDYQRRADTILKAKDTVIGKQPDTAIQINNSMPIQSGPTATLEEIKEVLANNAKV